MDRYRRVLISLTSFQQQIVEHALARFNVGEYFETHEVLEEAWLPAGEPARTFLKGLIHVAVSLYQYQRGNAHGARVKAASARRYLEPYLPQWGGLDLQALLEELERFVAPLQGLGRGAPLRPPEGPWPVLRRAPAETDE